MDITSKVGDMANSYEGTVRRSTRIANNGNRKMACPKCVQPANDLMVACDGCNVWHHHICVGLTEAIARSLPNWYCNSCQIIMNHESLTLTNTMMFNPTWASSTVIGTNDQTIIHDPATRNTNLVNGRANLTSPVNTLSQSNFDLIEQQKRLLEAEIEDTMRQLQITMASLQKSNRDVRDNNALSSINRTGVIGDNVASTSVKRTSRPIEIVNNHASSNRKLLLEEKERLVKLQIDLINEQLNDQLDDESLIHRNKSSDRVNVPNVFNMDMMVSIESIISMKKSRVLNNRLDQIRW